MASPCLLVLDSPMMGDRVVRWAASIRLAPVVRARDIGEQAEALSEGCQLWDQHW